MPSSSDANLRSIDTKNMDSVVSKAFLITHFHVATSVCLVYCTDATASLWCLSAASITQWLFYAWLAVWYLRPCCALWTVIACHVKQIGVKFLSRRNRLIYQSRATYGNSSRRACCKAPRKPMLKAFTLFISVRTAIWLMINREWWRKQMKKESKEDLKTFCVFKFLAECPFYTLQRQILYGENKKEMRA